MGSLFRVREWSAIKIDDDHGFDCNSLLVCNIDNTAGDGGKMNVWNPFFADDLVTDKMIVASLSGILRLYKSSNSHQATKGNQPLIEVDFGLPILALATGRLLPSSDSLHLLVLHPRKVCVYSLSGTAGLSEHGSSHNILLIYEHILQHSAFNVVVGPFGQVRGKDFICVQSLDGTLSFFEQETFTFRRILPNHLLPGPMDYCPTTDSFIVATSSKTIESYRYQIIAIAKEPESSREGESSRGKKVVADWNMVLGETVMDIKIVAQDKRGSFIIVLGERNLFVATDDGSPFFIKKFDFSPVSMFPYMNGETLMTLIVTEFSTLLCFAHQSLKWASQMSFPAIAIRLAQMSGIDGVIVALSDSGDLSCCYLGTNPSASVISVATEHIKIDHEEADKELQALRKVIREFQHEDASSVVPGSSRQTKILSPVQIEISEILESEMIGDSSSQVSVCGVTFRIRLTSQTVVHKVRLTIDLPSSIESSRRLFTHAKLVPKDPLEVIIGLTSVTNVLPMNMIMIATVVFYNEHEAPRLLTKRHQLPLKLVSKRIPHVIAQDEHSVSLALVSNAAIKLNQIFFDLENMSDDGASEIGLSLARNAVSVSIQGKGSQCKITIRSSSFPCLAFVADEMIHRLKSSGARFDAASLDKNLIPLSIYYDAIDQHLSLRHKLIFLKKSLSEQAAQFRVIEKRFLVKLKDRTPAPMDDIDNLIIFVNSRISDTAEQIIAADEEVAAVSAHLSSMTRLIMQLVAIMASMKSDQLHHMKALLHPADSCGRQESAEGWEERTEAALIDSLGQTAASLLTSTRFTDFRFRIADEAGDLQQLINRLIDSTLRRDTGTIKSDVAEVTSASPPPAGATNKMMPFVHPATEIIHEEEEEEDDDTEKRHESGSL